MLALVTEVGTLQFVMGGIEPEAAIAVPEDLADLALVPDRLVWDGEAIVDAATVTTWYLAPDGTRRAYRGGEDWAELTAGWADSIEPDGIGGWRVVDKLAALKERRKASIDSAAEHQRLRWITPGAGQAMTYQTKVEEARRLMTRPDPDAADPADFPLLGAEVGITAATLAGVALSVLDAFAQWIVIGSGIEAARLRAKADIDAAGTVADVDAVTVTWPAVSP